MSVNDGGETVRLGKEPVPKPPIYRGHFLFPGYEDPAVKSGDKISPTFMGAVYHDVVVIDLISGSPVVEILPETVVTWDLAPAAAAQI